MTRKPEEEESKPSPSISTKFLNKFTQTLVSQRRLWTSWILSSMILLTELPLKDLNSSDSTKEELFHQDRFNQLLNLSFQENSLDTLSQRELKPSQNISTMISNKNLFARITYYFYKIWIFFTFIDSLYFFWWKS